MDRERVVVAEILRPRGNRGEVLARSQTDVPGRLSSLKRAQVLLPTGQDVSVQIEEAWAHKQEWVFKFSGVDSIDAAEAFRGSDLWVEPGERGLLAEGEFFQSDLTGCQVIEHRSDVSVGIVEGWQEYGGPPLMEVAAGGRIVLVPFVASECEVDLPSKTIRMNLPDGLLDL